MRSGFIFNGYWSILFISPRLSKETYMAIINKFSDTKYFYIIKFCSSNFKVCQFVILDLDVVGLITNYIPET